MVPVLMGVIRPMTKVRQLPLAAGCQFSIAWLCLTLVADMILITKQARSTMQTIVASFQLSLSCSKKKDSSSLPSWPR